MSNIFHTVTYLINEIEVRAECTIESLTGVVDIAEASYQTGQLRAYLSHLRQTLIELEEQLGRDGKEIHRSLVTEDVIDEETINVGGSE